MDFLTLWNVHKRANAVVTSPHPNGSRTFLARHTELHYYPFSVGRWGAGAASVFSSAWRHHLCLLALGNTSWQKKKSSYSLSPFCPSVLDRMFRAAAVGQVNVMLEQQVGCWGKSEIISCQFALCEVSKVHLCSLILCVCGGGFLWSRVPSHSPRQNLFISSSTPTLRQLRLLCCTFSHTCRFSLAVKNDLDVEMWNVGVGWAVSSRPAHTHKTNPALFLFHCPSSDPLDHIDPVCRLFDRSWLCKCEPAPPTCCCSAGATHAYA